MTKIYKRFVFILSDYMGINKRAKMEIFALFLLI